MEDKNKKEINFWKTPCGRAIIRLGFWVLFFIILFCFLSCDSKKRIIKDKTNDVTPVKFIFYDEMVSQLLKNNYEFCYNLVIDNKKYSFSGKSDGKTIVGIKENDEEIIKYKKDDKGIYKITMDNVEPMNNLYENIDIKNIDLIMIFDKLKDIKYHIEKNDDERSIIYDNGLIVKTSLENIKNISFKIKEDVYDLNFTNVGKIENI